MQTQFFLTRHGQTEWNLQQKLQGQLDSPLTEAGIEQAKQLAHTIADQYIDLIACSPLPRAKHSAELCQQQLQSLEQQCPLLVMDQLIERHFGQWQGRLFQQLKNQPHFSEIFLDVTNYAPPAGESGLSCAARLQHSLKYLAEQNPARKILVITHGDVLRCFVEQLKQPSFCDAYSQYGNGVIFPLNYNHRHQAFVLQPDNS